MATADSRSKDGLSDPVFTTVSVQNGDGCLRITLPKDGAEALDIDAGDTLLVTGEEGGTCLKIRKGSPGLLE